MNWTQAELRCIKIGTATKRRNKKKLKITYQSKHIPAPYDCIICQLIAEDEHGNIHTSHEAIRRQSYARQVLDKFVEELKAYKGLAIRF